MQRWCCFRQGSSLHQNEHLIICVSFGKKMVLNNHCWSTIKDNFRVTKLQHNPKLLLFGFALVFKHTVWNGKKNAIIIRFWFIGRKILWFMTELDGCHMKSCYFVLVFYFHWLRKICHYNHKITLFVINHVAESQANCKNSRSVISRWMLWHWMEVNSQ